MQGAERDLARTGKSGHVPAENAGGVSEAGREERGTRYVDAREAARMLGISQREVRELTARGRLRMKTGGVAARLMVSESSVRELRSEIEQTR